MGKQNKTYRVEFNGQDFDIPGHQKITALLTLYNVDANQVRACTFEMRLVEYKLIEYDDDGGMIVEMIGDTDDLSNNGSMVERIKTITVQLDSPRGKHVRTPLHPNQAEIGDYIDGAVMGEKDNEG